MDVEINAVAVLVAAAVSMVVGGLWYSKPVFGKTWGKLEGIDEKKAKKDAPTALLGMAALSLVMAYVLAHVTYISDQFFTDTDFQGAALNTGFWMWLGFVAPVLVSNSLFNQRPWKSTVIHLGNWLVTLVGMGLAIGWVGL
jgi:hypothetical protein